MTPFVSVIIVNYNSGERLAKCLAHLHCQSDQEFEIIVIDNASTDGSECAVSPPARLVQAGSNLGFALANNIAARDAKGEWLAFLNPDAYAAPDWIEEFRKAVSRFPGVEAFGSTQIDAANVDRLDGAGDVCHALGLYYRGGFGHPTNAAPQSGECFSPCAAAAFYRRDVFERLGGFDERFFCYGEDVDLGFRLRQMGGRAVQLREVRVLHEGSGVTGRRSDFSIYHGVRNRIWLFHKNMPRPAYYILFPIQLLVNLAMLCRSFFAGEGRAYWRGMRDGYAGQKSIRVAVHKHGTEHSPELLRALTWSLRKLVKRAPDVRPLAD